MNASVGGPCRLAAVIIARDEARCIARCVRSVRDHVDRVIVLDTGSTDETAALASAAGAAVHRITWADDFSAARNDALALADADWHLVIDADEWLCGGQTALSALGAPAFVGQVRVDSTTNDTADDSADATDAAVSSWISRLLPRGVRYAGRVHEQPQHALPVQRTTIVLRHDGYVPARRRHKATRNRALLERALTEAPDDAYLHYQLGKDHEIDAGYAEAEFHYLAAQRAVGAFTQSYAHDLWLRRIHVLQQLGRHADAFLLAEAAIVRWPTSADVYFALGAALLDWAVCEPARAAELLPMAEASWTHCLHLGESDALEGAVAGRGSYLAAHNLAVVCAGTQRPDDAAHWYAQADRLRRAGRSTRE